jgi:phosphoribosylformylglycinamidine synthase subunit PurS
MADDYLHCGAELLFAQFTSEPRAPRCKALDCEESYPKTLAANYFLCFVPLSEQAHRPTLWSPKRFVCCRLPYNRPIPMKAFVYVSLKRSVLDPQGKTIEGALRKMGYQGLQDVRQGKFFELTLDGGLDRAQAEAEVGRIARDVLTNPVIEEFRYSIEDK